jgi:membrane-bound lytic murein transglycosylase D
MPRYLRDYVPVIVAMAIIGHNPGQYGLDAVGADTPVAYDSVHLESATDLRLAAECAQVSVGDLQHLNPSLLHLRAPAGFELALPEGSKARFLEALERIPEGDRIAWRMHWVEAGETWGQLSRRYGIGKARLAAVNHLPSDAPPPTGVALVLPEGAASPRSSLKAEKNR